MAFAVTVLRCTPMLSDHLWQRDSCLDRQWTPGFVTFSCMVVVTELLIKEQRWVILAQNKLTLRQILALLN